MISGRAQVGKYYISYFGRQQAPSKQAYPFGQEALELQGANVSIHAP